MKTKTSNQDLSQSSLSKSLMQSSSLHLTHSKSDLWKFYPTRLLSRNPPAPPYKRHTNIVYERSTLSFQSDDKDPQVSLPSMDDYYGDRSKILNMHSYKPCPTPFPTKPSNRKDLEFDSCFESGNLWKSFKNKEREYILLLQ